ncbi:TonB family protein [Stenotrophomonas sp. Y-13]|uniref:TonB family protein n=1 Tax=Stenotrophomonas sp. Y-13 TaxID=3384161 RepID=UPI0039172ED5
MARLRVPPCWLAAALLALSPLPALAQPVEGCPPFPAAANRAPHYPPPELWRLLGYVINVIIDTDACGRVDAARVEQGSGVAVLDAAALAAARAWTVPPEYRGQPRYRLPFAFEPLPEEIPAQAGRRLRDPFFDERRGGRVPMPALDADGMLPGYIADPYPIGFLAIPEAVATIGPLALFRRYGGQANFWLHDEEGLSLFQLEGAMMVRNRLVSDGRHRFVVTSVLCGSDLDACRQSLATLRASRGRQRPQAVAVATP